ncbi:hypothetical protein E7T09_04495 [Deinococcus sp. KSM4-11]|uniref:hypothetical protein n=1 Tax=Deinococcus sp. KSM4-11 TaxID=2568654 RepID=UPI0010A577E9|nr:hypothetical protein [Deinococcus sp. KSM4-11]THF88470.1 hypothetical protein E7T09_04495 [Deinococcus sp. KSM4-11]
MRKTSVTSQSSAAVIALTANVAATSTPVATITVPRGALYRLHNQNMVRGVPVNGTYLILDLRDATNAKISGASRILVATRGPADEFPKFHRAIPYSVWRDLDTTQQRNEDYKATIIGQTDLNVGVGIEIPEAHQLLVYVEGPQVVDWTKSFFQADFEELN